MNNVFCATVAVTLLEGAAYVLGALCVFGLIFLAQIELFDEDAKERRKKAKEKEEERRKRQAEKMGCAELLFGLFVELPMVIIGLLFCVAMIFLAIGLIGAGE